MQVSSDQFKRRARLALQDANLQKALGNVKTGFSARRAAAIARLPEFAELRDQARALKDHIIAHLDLYLEAFEAKVVASGGHVHWCRTAAEARETVLRICRNQNAKVVTKGKSMVTEEIGLNDYLAAHGIRPVETDLGEYILQLRKDHPSHIVAPAIHLTLNDVADTFHRHHGRPRAEDPALLMQEAREMLRREFVASDVGITGANFLVAETGSTVIVTNEGNGDLTQTLPKTHIVVSSIEKVVPTLEDMTLLLRLLARSATGQEFTVYNTLSTGPRRADDPDGPEHFHVVLVDNGRSAMIGSEFQSMLRCIRCAACMNHCPVYGAVGGQSYGWVYPGPMGAVLTPQLVGLEHTHPLPDATTSCGQCDAVCPVGIPLTSLMRRWRQRAFDQRLTSRATRWGLGAWVFFATRPRLYRRLAAASSWVLRLLGGRKGRLRRLPLAGGWTATRDFPAPSAKPFMQQWTDAERSRRK